eukprot:g218.t1
MLSELVSSWAAEALVPAKGLLGKLVGRAFRQLYILDGEELSMPEESEVARNLQLLGAARSVELREALPLLAKLQGSPKTAAAAALEEAQRLLHLRQTLWAVKARVRCLNSMLA